MLHSYPILCTRPGCSRKATHKIAARWSDGTTEELKTYSLCCAECLKEAFLAGRARRQQCRLTRGESLESPGIYDLARGRRDRELRRCLDLETRLLAE